MLETRASERLTVGAVQFKSCAGEIKKNINAALPLLERAVDAGAGLVLLPELWAVGYGIERPQDFAEPFGGPVTSFMSEFAHRRNVYVAGGYAELAEDGCAYDSAVFIGPDGNQLLNHRKVHLYTALGEDRVWNPGDKFEVVDTAFGRVGILICFDGDFGEAWRMLACRGADIILHPTAYESPCEEYGWWDTLYSAHAMSNAVWCISANLIGATPDGSSHFFGGSRILDPLGCEVAAAVRVPCGSSCVSDVLVAELMLAEGLRLGRQRNGCFLAERKPWLYGAPAFNPRAMA